MVLPIHIASSSTRCAFCHDQVQLLDRSVCAICLAMHHLECWREHGSCAACRATKVLTLEAEAAKTGKKVADWVEALRDEADKYRRRLAARALGELGPQAVPAVETLAGALQDGDPWVRKWSCWALGAIGPQAGAAIPALTGAREADAAERVRKAAGQAIAEIEERKKAEALKAARDASRAPVGAADRAESA